MRRILTTHKHQVKSKDSQSTQNKSNILIPQHLIHVDNLLSHISRHTILNINKHKFHSRKSSFFLKFSMLSILFSFFVYGFVGYKSNILNYINLIKFIIILFKYNTFI